LKVLNKNRVEEIIQNPGSWNNLGPYNDVVISTNIELFRNVHDISFPHRQDQSEISFIKATAENFTRKSAYSNEILMIDLDEVAIEDKKLLSEKNAITSGVIEKNNCFLISSGNDNYNIIVNEEDHFKIQTNNPGLQISETYQRASNIDDELNKYAVYAYSDELGYFTSNPANLGTGMSASVLFHFPVLTLLNKIPEVIKKAQDSGLLLSGIRDNGKNTFGCIYQLCNVPSIGLSEEKILETLNAVSLELVNLESSQRDDLISGDRTFIEDKIFRSYGILLYSRKINFPEAVSLLSDIRVGIILSLIKGIDLNQINELIINCQWSHLERIFEKQFHEVNNCSIFRASYLREQLKRSSIYG